MPNALFFLKGLVNLTRLVVGKVLPAESPMADVLIGR